MSGDRSAGSSPASETSEEIMEATYRALCDRGYAALTMQDIADESAKSKAALHYHYDTKDELLLSFLAYLFESFVDAYGDPEGDHAVERLVRFVDDILCRNDVEHDEAIQTAFLEIRAQAPYDEAYRDQLAAVDEFVRDQVEEIVRDGIEEGVIAESVDPADTAAFVATLIDGVNTRRISIGETGGGTRRTFVAYVREHVVAPGADVAVDPGGSPDPDGEGGNGEAGPENRERREGRKGSENRESGDTDPPGSNDDETEAAP